MLFQTAVPQIAGCVIVIILTLLVYMNEHCASENRRWDLCILRLGICSTTWHSSTFSHYNCVNVYDDACLCLTGQLAYPDVTVYGNAIASAHVERLAKEAVTQVGTDIVSFVAFTWRQSDQGAVAASFKPVIAIGGGVYYFYAVLKEQIPHLARTTDPIHTNAHGYCTLAARLLARKQQSHLTSEE